LLIPYIYTEDFCPEIARFSGYRVGVSPHIPRVFSRDVFSNYPEGKWGSFLIQVSGILSLALRHLPDIVSAVPSAPYSEAQWN
jgi:hypothetical protein